jgi:hypothetical protein
MPEIYTEIITGPYPPTLIVGSLLQHIKDNSLLPEINTETITGPYPPT